jgi:hypothetical protein
MAMSGSCHYNHEALITACGSCNGNHERKERVEWKVEWRVPDCCGVAAHWPNKYRDLNLSREAHHQISGQMSTSSQASDFFVSLGSSAAQ